jgi:hypothetical protein
MHETFQPKLEMGQGQDVLEAAVRETVEDLWPHAPNRPCQRSSAQALLDTLSGGKSKSEYG